MKRKQSLIFLFIVLCLSAGSSYAQPWAGIIDSSRAIDWTSAGIPGGIPNRTAICATLNPGATSSQINSAIASCAANQVVKLNAGTYNLTAGITFQGHNNVTLRGAGPDQTFLVFSGSDSCDGLGADICVINSTGYAPGGTIPSGNTANWTAGYSKGTTQITLSNVSGLSAGNIIVLDQLDDSSDTGNVFVCQAANTCATEGPGGQGRPNRAQEQWVRVTNVSGSQVTVTPGLYMPNWRSSQSPGAFWTGPQAESDGIEDLSMDHTNETGKSGICFLNAHNSWLRNVKSLNANRNHVWLYLASHIQVQDSYFYGTQNAASQSYGVESYGASDNLVQNNIFQHITGPLVTDNTSGSVMAYNYAIDDYYSIVADWMQPSQSIHAGGVSYLLYEGNTGAGFEADAIHGTSDLVTMFRNYWLGWETGKNQQTIPVYLYAFHRYFNVVGNVLGHSGTQTNYENAAPSGTGTDVSIYALGYSGNQATASNVPNDTLVKTTLMRWGNYDIVNNGVRWVSSEVPSGLSLYPNPLPTSQNLPPSFYLSTKPAWWGTMPWPAIGPDVTGGTGPGGHTYTNPAQVCYNNTAKDGNGILIFNANTCYQSLGPVAPTNLSAVAH